MSWTIVKCQCGNGAGGCEKKRNEMKWKDSSSSSSSSSLMMADNKKSTQKRQQCWVRRWQERKCWPTVTNNGKKVEKKELQQNINKQTVKNKVKLCKLSQFRGLKWKVDCYSDPAAPNQPATSYQLPLVTAPIPLSEGGNSPLCQEIKYNLWMHLLFVFKTPVICRCW